MSKINSKVMLFKTNPIPSWIFNPKTMRIQDVNHAAIERYGYSREEFLSMSVVELFYGNSVGIFRKKINDIDQNRNKVGFWEHKTKDGRLIYVEIFIQELDKNMDDRLLLAQNITKHVLLERKLERAYQQLRFHVNNSPLGVIEWDQNFRIKKWSKKAEEIFGWKMEEVKGKSPDDFNFIDDEDYERVAPFMKKLMKGSLTNGRMNNRNRTKNGSVVSCEWYNSVLVDEDGKLVSILSQVQEVTQREKYELLILEQKRILQLIASGEKLSNILEQIILLIQQYTRYAVCTIMVRDDDVLVLKAAPNMPAELSKLIEKVKISPTEGGICGAAAYRKEEVLVENMSETPLLTAWSEAVKIAQKNNLNTCRSIPIMSTSGEVIGTFAFYYQSTEDIKFEYEDTIQIATDLTGIAIERDLNQSTLAESEAKFKTLFEYANDGIFILDGMHFIESNRRTLELFGCSKSYILGKTPMDFSPRKQYDGSDSIKKINEKINLALDGTPQFFSWTHLKMSGEPIEVQVSLNRVPIAGKYYVQAIVRDITKQKRVERELKESRLRMSKLLQNLPGMVYRCRNDRDWTLDFVSEGCYKLTGYTADELMNDEWRRFASLIVPEDRDMVWRDVQEALKENRSFELEYRIRTADGLIKWVWEKGSSLYSQEEEDVFLEGFITDITERKKAQEDLRIKEKAIESSNNSIILVDLHGYITYANPSFLNMWGYDDASKVLGKRISLFNGDISELFMINNILREHGSWSGEIETKKNGDLFVVQVSANMVTDNDGAPVCMMASLIDVTDRNLAELKLRNSLKEKEVLLSEIHHRVKNNLAVISGLLQLQAYNTDYEEVKDVLQDSQSRIQSIAMIHEKLYRSDTFSSIELKNYISELVNNIQDTYHKENIIISIVADEIFLKITQAIPCALILNELLVNAFKHAFKGREKGRIVINMYLSSTGVRLSVKDDGVGLPENFDLLSQKSLGMTLIKTLVRQLNADFDIKKGKGSEFIVQFAVL